MESQTALKGILLPTQKQAVFRIHTPLFPSNKSPLDFPDSVLDKDPWETFLLQKFSTLNQIHH